MFSGNLTRDNDRIEQFISKLNFVVILSSLWFKEFVITIGCSKILPTDNYPWHMTTKTRSVTTINLPKILITTP